MVHSLHSYKCYKHVASCGFFLLVASCQQVEASLLTSSSGASLRKSDLLQLASSLLIKSLNYQFAASLLTTCSTQVGASDANASWYGLDYRSLRQTCCNLRISGCI